MLSSSNIGIKTGNSDINATNTFVRVVDEGEQKSLSLSTTSPSSHWMLSVLSSFGCGDGVSNKQSSTTNNSTVSMEVTDNVTCRPTAAADISATAPDPDDVDDDLEALAGGAVATTTT